MSQRQRNIRQLIYLAILVGVTSTVALINKNESGIDFDKRKFILDENTVITTVVLEHKTGTNRFEYFNNSWQVNGKYFMDDGMRDVFFALLSRVEVKRPVASSERDSLSQHLIEEGVKATVLNNADTIKTFLVSGNNDLFQTYFMEPSEQQPYIVHIPGYQSYLAGIFFANENDWRSRFIWDVDWTSLKSLSVDFEGDNDQLRFVYEGNFMTVEGVTQLDTAGMMSYLEYVAFLQTDKYLEKGEIVEYDQSINENSPLVSLQVEQIGDRRSALEIYPSPEGKEYLPGILNENQLLLFSPSTLESLKAKASDFGLTE